MGDQRRSVRRRAAMLAGGVAFGVAGLAATTQPASAAVVQRARVTNFGFGAANSGGKVAIGDASHNTTSPGGTSVSHGTATVTTGRATAAGNISGTGLFQRAWHL